jgi:hypothetical protein
MFAIARASEKREGMVVSRLLFRSGFGGRGSVVRGGGSEFGVLCSGFGVLCSGFGFRVSGFGFRVSGFGVRGSGFGVRSSVFGARCWVLGVGCSGFGLRGRGVGCMVCTCVQGVGFRGQGV